MCDCTLSHCWYSCVQCVCMFCAWVCIEICVFMQVILHLLYSLYAYEVIFFFQPKSPLCHLHPLLRLPPPPPPISPLISCLFLKPCGTRPVCPSQEVWGRMAASWRQTAPRPCMLATPPSDTPALQWSPPDCPENQKHLLCLNDTQTYRLRHGHAHTYSITHILFSFITHTHKHAYSYRYSNANAQIQTHWTHIFTHWNTQTHTPHHHLTFLLPLTYFTRDKRNTTVERHRKQKTMWSHLPAAFIL